MLASSQISLCENDFSSDQTTLTALTHWRSFLQIAGASALLTLCSQIKVVLPFTFVPLTLQTLAVLMIAVSLGSQKGTLAVLLYFGEILIGLPVLAGGICDPLVFIGPKGGYYLGFWLQAFLMGRAVGKFPFSRPANLFFGAIAACTAQMAMGISVLAQFVGWSDVWTLGLFPFILGECIKILIVCFSSIKRSKIKLLATGRGNIRE